ncbi:hypothetical protein [Pseudomonas mohnii]
MVFLLLLASVAGAVLPLHFADLTAQQANLWTGMGSTTVAYTYLAIRKVGRSSPVFWRWVLHARSGVVITGFFGGAISSAAGVALALAPFPYLAQIIMCFVLALFAFALLINDSPVNKEQQ